MRLLGVTSRRFALGGLAARGREAAPITILIAISCANPYHMLLWPDDRKCELLDKSGRASPNRADRYEPTGPGGAGQRLCVQPGVRVEDRPHFFNFFAHNPLKSPDSTKEIQAKPSIFAWI